MKAAPFGSLALEATLSANAARRAQERAGEREQLDATKRDGGEVPRSDKRGRCGRARLIGRRLAPDHYAKQGYRDTKNSDFYTPRGVATDWVGDLSFLPNTVPFEPVFFNCLKQKGEGGAGEWTVTPEILSSVGQQH